jgi:hypothetical protein
MLSSRDQSKVGTTMVPNAHHDDQLRNVVGLCFSPATTATKQGRSKQASKHARNSLLGK